MDAFWVNIWMVLVVLACAYMLVGTKLTFLAANYHYINKWCFDASQLDKLCKFESKFWNPDTKTWFPDYGHTRAANGFTPFLVPFAHLQAIICVFIMCMHILFIVGAVITRRKV